MALGNLDDRYAASAGFIVCFSIWEKLSCPPFAARDSSGRCVKSKKANVISKFLKTTPPEPTWRQRRLDGEVASNDVRIAPRQDFADGAGRVVDKSDRESERRGDGGQADLSALALDGPPQLGRLGP